MARQDREERRRADRTARRLRSEDSWLELHTRVFSEHETEPGVRRIPPGILNRSDNYEQNSVDGVAIASGETNEERAIDSAHQKDNSTTNRILAADAVDARVLRGGTVRDNHVAGRLGRSSLPADTHFGKVRARAGGADDMDWGDRSIPKRALPNLTAEDVGAASRQSINNLSESVSRLRQKIKQLEGR